MVSRRGTIGPRPISGEVRRNAEAGLSPRHRECAEDVKRVGLFARPEHVDALNSAVMAPARISFWRNVRADVGDFAFRLRLRFLGWRLSCRRRSAASTASGRAKGARPRPALRRRVSISWRSPCVPASAGAGPLSSPMHEHRDPAYSPSSGATRAGLRLFYSAGDPTERDALTMTERSVRGCAGRSNGLSDRWGTTKAGSSRIAPHAR